MMKSTLIAGLAALAALAGGPALAQEAAGTVPEHSAFVFNTTLFLISGFLVMFMACGFAMLEAGLVRSKNVAMQCTKNIALFSIASVMFWLVGYNIMYPGDGWIIQDVLGTPIPKAIDPVGDASGALGPVTRPARITSSS